MLYVEADEIIKDLWQGSFPEPGREVGLSGFNVLVLCAEELQIGEEEYPKVRVINAPNRDNEKLSRKNLAIAIAAAREVVEAVKAGQKVLVTCAEGINRSSLVTAIALHLLKGWTGTQCIEHIRNTRHWRKGYMPLFNKAFCKALEKLDLTEKDLPQGWAKSPGGVLLPPGSR